MNKFTIVGIGAFIGGAVLLGFQTISTLMQTEGGPLMHTKSGWKQMALVDIFNAKSFDWIDSLSWQTLQHVANYIVTMPLFLLLFVIGALAFVLNAFFGK